MGGRRQEMLSGVTPGQRSRLFREVNDRIHELLASAEPDLPGEFLCECGRDCGQRVELLPAAFAELRRAEAAVCSPSCRGPRLRLRGLRTRAADGAPVLSKVS
ncbi:MAG: hypothetical protein ACJ75L_10280 [Gaiellaceae bacterium]